MSSADSDIATRRVVDELKRLYRAKILPLEQAYMYEIFHSPPLSTAEFDAKPQVMLVGQYSVGKTSFIRYLIGRDFPGQRIGPEPTTDRWVAVMDGPDERTIPGHALAVSHELPYRGLERFGVSFLNRFEGAQVPSPVLRNITLIDTPGVLSGEKQRVNRGYDFTHVCTWFAARADLILILFDAHKLDISDEFRNVIEALRGNDDKIRCILNKADQVDRQRLLRVYGALMWSIGKVIKTPEVLRVYVGSFWDEPLQYEDNATLFEMEQEDLMRDLRDLPRNSAVRKINELVKRVRIGKVHAYILAYLRDQMPMLMGHAKKQQQILNDLPSQFRSVMKKYSLAPGDFPDINSFRSILAEQDFTKFPQLKQKLIDDVDTVLGKDLPRLMDALPRSWEAFDLSEEAPASSDNGNAANYGQDEGFTPPNPPLEDTSPFGQDTVDLPSDGRVDAYASFEAEHREAFNAAQEGGFVSGGKAKEILLSHNLEKKVLRRLWNLADLDRDGQLDLPEFVTAMRLVKLAKDGAAMPETLPDDMVPPSKSAS